MTKRDACIGKFAVWATGSDIDASDAARVRGGKR